MFEKLLRVFTDPAAEPWLHAWMVFLGSSFGGLATHLREGGPLLMKSVGASMLNSGLQGLIVFLVAYNELKHDLMLLVGISLLAGVGGASLMTFFLELLKRFLLTWAGIKETNLKDKP